MKIRDAHLALAAIVEGITITDPAAMGIERVWPFIPDANQAIVERTAIMWYDLTSTEFITNSVVKQQYDIHLQLFATPAEVDAGQGSAIASQFLDAIVTALSAHTRLGGEVDLVRELRGANPGQGTLTVLEWAFVRFVGLDLVIPITLTDTRERGA